MTHPITETTQVPFPCWVHETTVPPYFWWWCASKTEYLLEMELGSSFSHYSTNPPDQKPEAGEQHTLVMDGMSPHTVDSLIRCADGDFSDFDEVDRRLKAQDAHLSNPPHPDRCMEAARNIVIEPVAGNGTTPTQDTLDEVERVAAIIRRLVEGPLEARLATQDNLSRVRDETHEGIVRALRARLETVEKERDKLVRFYDEIVREIGHDRIVTEHRQRGELLRQEAQRRKDAESQLAAAQRVIEELRVSGLKRQEELAAAHQKLKENGL